MGALVSVGLGLLAFALFFAARKRWIGNDTLQTLANIGAIVALAAAILIFVVPAAVPQGTSSPAGSNPSSVYAATAPGGLWGDTGDFSEWLALKLMFGSDAEVYSDSSKLYVVWELPNQEAEDLVGFPNEAGYVYSTVISAFPFREEDNDKYFILTQTKPLEEYECHACSPVLGGAVFSNEGNIWQIEASERLIMRMGEFGQAPDPELVKIGPDKHGVLFRARYTNQGFSVEETVLIGKVDQSLGVMLSLDTHAAYQGECDYYPCWSYSSDTRFVPGQSPEFYDFIVTTYGTKLVESSVVPFREIKSFVFTQGEYTLSNTQYTEY